MAYKNKENLKSTLRAANVHTRDDFGLNRKKDPPAPLSISHPGPLSPTDLNHFTNHIFFAQLMAVHCLSITLCGEERRKKEAYNLIEKAKAASGVTHFHTKTLSRCTKVDWEIFSSDPRAILNKFSNAYTANDTRANVKERKTIGITFFCSARALTVCSTLYFKWWSQRRKIVSKEKIRSTQAELVHECWACKPRRRQM